MKKGKKFIIAVAIILGAALVSGLTALAVTNYGSQSDPLVTLSYLNTVKSSILTELQGDLDEKASEWEKSLGGSGNSSALPGFSVVTLTNGQTVICGVGTEIMLRIGTAVTYGNDSPRLINETTGNAVSSSGTALNTNHMYMVTIKGNGIRATAATVKILIRGDYTIS